MFTSVFIRSATCIPADSYCLGPSADGRQHMTAHDLGGWSVAGRLLTLLPVLPEGSCLPAAPLPSPTRGYVKTQHKSRVEGCSGSQESQDHPQKGSHALTQSVDGAPAATLLSWSLLKLRSFTGFQVGSSGGQNRIIGDLFCSSSSTHLVLSQRP